MKIFCYFLICLIFKAQFGFSDKGQQLVTQTVYGFLDYTTIIGNTVLIFTPQSVRAVDLNKNIDVPVQVIETQPIQKSTKKELETEIKPTKSTSEQSVEPSTEASKTETKIATKETTELVLSTSENKINEKPKADKETLVKLDNDFYKPEYDLLSRQPAAYVEETYRLINLTNSRHIDGGRTPNVPRKSHIANNSNTPVSKLAETKIVLGTKYSPNAQNSISSKKHKIRPSSPLRVLKTVAPVIPNSDNKDNSPFRKANRHRNPNSDAGTDAIHDEESKKQAIVVTPSKNSQRHKSKRRSKRPRGSAQKLNQIASSSLAPIDNNRRSFRPKVQISTIEADSPTSLYLFKLNRTPGRWQYKSSPKPRVTIRKHIDDTTPNSFLNTTISDSTLDESNNASLTQNLVLDGDLESLGSQNGAVINNIESDNKRKLFIETLNVEISTPPNFKDTYYEIATIKTPFTFQAGVVKKTRFITVTSTIEKILTSEASSSLSESEPLTENILAPSTKEHLSLDGSVTTLMALHLNNDAETPSLETITESFTFTQTKLKTQLLPIIKDNATSYITFIQTYDITSLITATKTLPIDYSEFMPTQNFKDFEGNLDEAGSEVNLELEFGDEDNENLSDTDKNHNLKKNGIDSSTIKSKSVIPPDPLQTILPDPLHQVAQISRPVIKQETLWESYVVPITNGASTSFRTLSKSIGVVDKTEYEIDTTTLVVPQIQQPLSVNPYLLPVPPQPFQTIISSLVQPTVITQTNSKVLKLTFGARTAYTTIFSTNIIPTALTTYVTTSVPVQPSAPYPGYFPPPYPPYGYLG